MGFVAHDNIPFYNKWDNRRGGEEMNSIWDFEERGQLGRNSNQGLWDGAEIQSKNTEQNGNSSKHMTQSIQIPTPPLPGVSRDL